MLYIQWQLLLRQLSMFLLTQVVCLNGFVSCKIYLWKILQRFVAAHSYINTHGYWLDALSSVIYFSSIHWLYLSGYSSNFTNHWIWPWRFLFLIFFSIYHRISSSLSTFCNSDSLKFHLMGSFVKSFILYMGIACSFLILKISLVNVSSEDLSNIMLIREIRTRSLILNRYFIIFFLSGLGFNYM